MQSAKIPLAFAFHRATPAEAQLNSWHTAPLATAAALAMTHSPVPALAPLQVFSAEPFAWPDPVARKPLGGIPQHTPKLSSAASQSHEFMSPLVTAPTNAARDTLQAAHALADGGRLTEAANAINVYLEQHAPHADAFYLLGVLADASGDTNLARGQYRKALYLEPQHAEALAHLATLLELEGDRNGARLLMDRASRAQGAQRG